MDLLYKHERYDDLYKIFETVVEKQIHMLKYPKNCVNLVMAACYKQVSFTRKTWELLKNILYL